MAGFQASNFGVMSLGLLVIFFTCLCPKASAYYRRKHHECELILEPLCQGKYDYTVMPNILGHESQAEASERLREFAPLLESNCSQELQFFLCSLHFPMCHTELTAGIPACRGVCQNVRNKCEPYMNVFSLSWPETLECNKLPETNFCLSPNRGEEDNNESSEATDDDDVIHEESKKPRKKQEARKGKKKDRKRKENKEREKPEERPKDVLVLQEGGGPSHGVVLVGDGGEDKGQKEAEVIRNEVTMPNILPHNTQSEGKVWLPAKPEDLFPESDAEPEDPYNDFSDYSFDYDNEERQSRFLPADSENSVPVQFSKCENQDKFVYSKKLDRCLPVCDVNVDVMFSSDDKYFAYFWMLGCSILCLVSSALTVGTFLVDSKRFRYPERPIIFLSLCYILYSSAYLVRLGGGPASSVSCVTKDNSDVTHVVMGDLESTGCTAVFFLLYYFGMAAAVWWVILSITWFLAAGLKWGHEAIEAKGFYFHLVAWLLPAAQTIVVLVTAKVDGDELTGLCYIGNLDEDSLLYFVIVPLTSYLSVGALALGCGFGSLLKIRRVILTKNGEKKDAGKLEKLMLKIGIFTVLYIVPTVCVVAVHIYQYKNYSSWLAVAERTSCTPPRSSGGYGKNVADPPMYNMYSYFSDRNYYGNSDDYAYYEPRYNPYESQFDPERQFQNQHAVYRPSSPRELNPFVPSAYRHQSGVDTKLESGKTSGERYNTVYTGKDLYEVPPNLNRGYGKSHLPYRENPRPRPMGYSQELAQMYRTDSDMENIQRNPPQFSEEHYEPKIDRDCHLVESIPPFPIFAIKILMSLLAGITSGIWVWSRKTWKSWRKACRACWCSVDDKDIVAPTNSARSSGNMLAASSMTSQLYTKANNRMSVENGEYRNFLNNNRDSYPIMTSERYSQTAGFDSVHKIHSNCRSSYTSSIEPRRHQGNLTLGDLAREYRKPGDEEYRQIEGSEAFNNDAHTLHNPNYVMSPLDNDNRPNGGKVYKTDKKSKKKTKDSKKTLDCMKPKKHLQTENTVKSSGGKIVKPSTNELQNKNRAIPNSYEIAPTNQRSLSPPAANENETRHNYEDGMKEKGRVRKYSENDVNLLPTVSQNIPLVTNTTRKKSESVNMGIMTSV